jgi:hypothetical protein
VIFDQAEVSSLRNSIIDSGGGVGNAVSVWLTNGNERTAGANGFTNGVTLDGNQFNGGTDGRAMVVWTESHGSWHEGFNVTGNNIQPATGRNGAFDVSRLRWSFIGYNYDGATSGAHFTGIHTGSDWNKLINPGGVAWSEGVLIP